VFDFQTVSNEITSPLPVSDTTALARHLGLSRWTVSRVLNNHQGIKAETRDRVMQAVRELGFEPNRLARGLRGAPSRLVGVCFQQFEVPSLARKTGVLQQHLRKHGYRGIIELTAGDQNLEAAIIRHFLSIKVDGIVLVASALHADDPVLEQARSADVPVVAVDPIHRLPLPQVALDRARAMEMKLRHLFDLGHRRFALLGINNDPFYSAVRRRSLRAAAKRLGLDPGRDLVFLNHPGFDAQDYQFGSALGRAFLDLPQPRPTGLIALNDRIAIAAARTLLEAGHTIPGDYSIIGFDNLDVAAWVRPSLSTVSQNVETLMAAATDCLLAAIAGTAAPGAERQLIAPILIARDSTGPAPVAAGQPATAV
jgi:DNA-binding LacI/PurR family transcriptional regulator